ncbi:respiratory chain complex I subunit 1 family protein [Sporolituus thermophilus]|uniref:Formate hydrogenlyase subunit 4 n=1 Tax=Sporolituus thermophilus DSM 23256 TaxID=1123285 RepID=A0A1G7ISF0_9FIRM|nr:NADH-quinone oxidoreductase subunit H [Sporolituus thermophilus]SDF15239.1 Formate hydrogenlyase subunit 4 [Sporolituus thermophilus DSM 23256]
MINIIGMVVLMLAAPLVAGVIKTVKARLQNRRGPSLLQPYFDLAKLFGKDSVFSSTVSWVFRGAPFVYFGATAGAAALLPVGDGAVSLADLFILVYLFALGRFFLALASLDAGSAFGGMGGSREMYIAVLVEPALLLALLTVVMPAGGTDLAGMAAAAGRAPLSLPHVLAALAFFFVVIAETGRIPVDNPDTHLELTMVHEGMVLEYSGRYLGLIHWAAMVKQLIMLTLFVTYFVPWGWGPAGLTGGALWFAGKVLLAAVLLGVVETSTNKMRLFRLPHFFAISCLLSLLALIAQ